MSNSVDRELGLPQWSNIICSLRSGAIHILGTVADGTKFFFLLLRFLPSPPAFYFAFLFEYITFQTSFFPLLVVIDCNSDVRVSIDAKSAIGEPGAYQFSSRMSSWGVKMRRISALVSI